MKTWPEPMKAWTFYFSEANHWENYSLFQLPISLFSWDFLSSYSLSRLSAGLLSFFSFFIIWKWALNKKLMEFFTKKFIWEKYRRLICKTSKVNCCSDQIRVILIYKTQFICYIWFFCILILETEILLQNLVREFFRLDNLSIIFEVKTVVLIVNSPF